MPRLPVHVVHLIPTLERAGAEHALARLVQHSDPVRVRHTVISLTARGPLAESIESAGGTVLALGRRGPASMIAALPRLLGQVKAARPDVLQGWMVHANILAWLARGLAAPSARLAWNLRGQAKGIVHENRLTRALIRAAAMVSGGVDLLIANSSAAMNGHLELGYAPGARVVAPNGFDLDLFRPDAPERDRMRDEIGLPADAVAFGLVGRFHPVKGHKLFIEAAAEVSRREPRAVFVLVGAGTQDAPEIDALLARHGVADRFRRLGARSDVARVMQALDVLCAPSFYESFPNAVGEAMASGVPCVAADVSDVRAILGDGGVIVPVGDAPALAKAMIALAGDAADRRRRGAEGRRRAEQHYSIASVAERYDQLYVALQTSPTETTRVAGALAAL